MASQIYELAVNSGGYLVQGVPGGIQAILDKMGEMENKLNSQAEQLAEIQIALNGITTKLPNPIIE